MAQQQSLISHLLAGVIGGAIVLGGQSLLKPTMETTDAPDAFGNQVYEYLMSNPGVVIEAFKKNQDNEQQAQLNAASEIIKADSATIFNHPASPVLGNASGDVTLVEFFDYNCGYCRHNSPDVEKLIGADTNLRVIHKQLPILGPDSVEATKVVLAAQMQDPASYAKLHHAFMSQEGKLKMPDIERITREAGLNWEKILVDKESAAIGEEIKANYALAQKLGLTGTPGFIVGHNLLPGAQSFDALKTAIEGVRTANASNAPAEPAAASPTDSSAAPAPANTDAAAPTADETGTAAPTPAE
jgi:protein-disulfide isomerase